MTVTSIRNQTPSKLTLTGVEGEHLVFAPLQEKTLDDDSFFFEEVEREGLVYLGKETPQEVGERIAVILFGGGFWSVLIAWGISKAGPFGGVSEQAWTIGVWSTIMAVLAIIVTIVVIRATNSVSLVARFTMQVASLTVILAIGLGLPAAAIYYFGCGRELLDVPEANPLSLFARLIQLAFIAIASLLPVLLFFLFDRFQLATLRKRLYLDLFRLDPSVSTIGEIDAKYGSQISEAYGPESQSQGRLAPGSRWPVLVCAFVITIGWIVALAPIGLNFSPENVSDALAVLKPQPTALVFGFLGAYFFSLRLIALRYARGDLKPKAYSHIMVRILIVMVLSWVLDAIFKEGSITMLVLAFLFGITPDEFFTWLKEAIRSNTLPFFSKLLPASIIPEPPKLPLTDLDGIDLYDRSRLESEGIVNIEGLAHHELVDLIIETRGPVPRLIDWMDQAILYLHLVGGSDVEARTKLRNYGIRTATDLIGTWVSAEDRAKLQGDQSEFENFKRLLGDEQPPYRLEVIRDALLDDEWMATVICWRNNAGRMEHERSALPTTVEGFERFAKTQEENQRYGAALEILEQSLKKRDTASSRLQIASILATSKVPEHRNWELAREHANRAAELAPGDQGVIKQLIKIYTTIEDYENALRMCEEALKIVSDWHNGKRKQNEIKRLQEIKDQLQNQSDS